MSFDCSQRYRHFVSISDFYFKYLRHHRSRHLHIIAVLFLRLNSELLRLNTCFELLREDTGSIAQSVRASC